MGHSDNASTSPSTTTVEDARQQDNTSGPKAQEEEERCSDVPAKETPLPKLQLFFLLYLQLAEPITSTVIYPFVNQLVRQTGVTGGDERKTGYFAGLIVRPINRPSRVCCFAHGLSTARNPRSTPWRRSASSNGDVRRTALGASLSCLPDF